MASLPRDWGNLRIRNSRPHSKWRISLDVPPEGATSRCKWQHRQVVWVEHGYRRAQKGGRSRPAKRSLSCRSPKTKSYRQLRLEGSQWGDFLVRRDLPYLRVRPLG